jgi:hypothetical protein
MRDDRQRQPAGAVPRKEGSYDPAPGIVPLAAWPGIDEDPMTRRGAEQGRIPLSDIEKM